MKIASYLHRTLGSAKFAIALLALFAAGMIAGTIYESLYGSGYANTAVYSAWWFYTIQFFILLSLVVAVIDRIPFRKRLAGFYIIHAAVVTIILGSVVTKIYGIDGEVPLQINQPANQIQLNQDALFVSAKDLDIEFELRQTVRPIESKIDIFSNETLNLSLLKYYPYAKVESAWETHPDFWSTEWLISNDKFSEPLHLAYPATSVVASEAELGPLSLRALSLEEFNLRTAPAQSHARLHLKYNPKGSSGPEVLMARDSQRGILLAFKDQEKWQRHKVTQQALKLPWMNFSISLIADHDRQKPVLHFFKGEAHKEPEKNARAALVQIHFKQGKLAGTEHQFWLSDFSKETLQVDNLTFTGSIGKKIITLPFSLTLLDFKMAKNPGTMDAASYESFVTINNEEPKQHVYMNHPLKKESFTFYQSSYFQDEEGHFHSVFSVNRDPGRMIKYFGAFLLVLGLTLHYLLVHRIIRPE